jgi:hypothetical protein
MALKETDAALVDARIEATAALFGIDPSRYQATPPAAAAPEPESLPATLPATQRGAK